jgi:hypothetical protein
VPSLAKGKQLLKRNRPPDGSPERGSTRLALDKTNYADDDTLCTNCRRPYSDPEFIAFHWVQCIQCHGWYHEICDDACHLTGTCSACRRADGVK